MRKYRLRKWVKCFIGVFTVFIVVIFILSFISNVSNIDTSNIKKKQIYNKLKDTAIPEYITIDLIPKEIGHSRNGKRLDTVNNIVIHYVGNPNTSAKNNRDYFANIGTTVNAHFIVGLDGEIIQCIPLFERSCASNHRNKDTISIEVCHPDAIGEFNEQTKASLVKLTAWLCQVCELTEKDVIRHYDITGKLCPIYYVNNENEWNELLNKIKIELSNE